MSEPASRNGVRSAGMCTTHASGTRCFYALSNSLLNYRCTERDRSIVGADRCKVSVGTCIQRSNPIRLIIPSVPLRWGRSAAGRLVRHVRCAGRSVVWVRLAGMYASRCWQLVRCLACFATCAVSRLAVRATSSDGLGMRQLGLQHFRLELSFPKCTVCS